MSWLRNVFSGGDGGGSAPPENLDSYYQRIGDLVAAEAHAPAEKILAYAEVQDGAISLDLFSAGVDGPVRMRFASARLKELVCEFWERWLAAGQTEWRGLEYFIDGGKFRINFTCPDSVDIDVDTSERREVVYANYFGDRPLDYSQITAMGKSPAP